ncbi:MAG: right-handed parallel beta-helix repeat-containing protein, partial [Bacteroidales bacterium]|nr:right-handed parallel beta-helix repeat-containing protein [Bacteroidales bacterium]
MKRFILFFFLLLSCFVSVRAQIVVTSNANSGSNTLRQAIADVSSGGTITFNLSAGNEIIKLSSELAITKAMTIDGKNSAGSGVDVTVQVTTPGSSSWRVFQITSSGSAINIHNMTMLGGGTGGSYGGVIRINPGATVNLTGITMSNGKSNYGGGVFLTGSTTTLAVTNSTLSNNSTTSQHGGWIYNEGGIVSVSSCTFSGNTGVCGGAIFNAISTSSLLVTSCEFTGNSGNGGAIYNEGTATITGSTLYSNTSASIGGAITSWGPVTITSSTISGNTATTDGGGIYKGGANNLIITSSTISGNTSGGNKGGGIYNSTGSCYLLNSIIINNTSSAGADLYNVSGSTYAYYCWYNGASGTINAQATAPNVTSAYVSGYLAPLANNGGPSKTMAVSPASPAPDNGAFVYYNSSYGYYFVDNQPTPVSHKLIDWATNPPVLPVYKITADQRGTTIGAPPTIGSYFLIPVHIVSTAGTLSADYNTLKQAADAINAGTHQGTITITLLGSTVETSSVVFNASNSPASYASINIYPVATGLSISGNLSTTPVIDLNGADNVTIDGRVNATGSAKDLIIINSSTPLNGGPSTIKFRNDACSNTIKYCTIKGNSGVGYPTGVILFSGSTGTTGNDENAIDNNSITNAADASRPGYAIFSSGTSAKNNSGNTITNNCIYNILQKSYSSSCIYLYGNSDNWTISGNSFYETASFATTANSMDYSIISINSGSGYTISSNYIGGSGAGCSGAWTKTGDFSNDFIGIYISSSSAITACEIQGNTIKNINWATSSSSWSGIKVEGSVISNIGTTTGNVIGAATGNGSVTFTQNTNNAANGFYGIELSSSGTTVVQNNVVGAITTNNSNTGYPCHFYGIYSSGTGNRTISANTIGSTDAGANNSIFAASPTTTSEQTVYGIQSLGSGSVAISGNTISKMTNNDTDVGYGGTIKGIYVTNGTNTISGNTVRDLTIANEYASGTYAASVIGIALNYTTVAAQSITDNTIYNLSNTNASFTGNVIGLYFNGSTTAGAVSGNFIYGLSVTGVSSTAASIYGIKINAGATTYANNIISLGGNTKTTIYGIYETGAANNNNNLYFNTVYLGGTLASGSANKSYALYSAVTTNTRNFRNNIFCNARSTDGGSNLHYAMYILTSGGTITSDYNDYFASETGSVLGYYGANISVLPIVTGQDAYSLNTNPSFASAGGALPEDYKPMVNTLNGVSGTGTLNDYANVTRSLTTPSMGAYELFYPISVTATLGTTSGLYPSLKASFDAINAGTHQGDITIMINKSTSETAAAVLNASSSGSASYTSVNIYPTATGLSVNGNLPTPLIDLNGSDNVTIDGRVNATGSTKDLVITNTSTSSTSGTSTIRFINDASNNTVKYCTLKGSSTDASAGIVFFSTTTGNTGNDGNTIDNNDITNTINRPVYAILSSGTSGITNSEDTIRNNRIYDVLYLSGNSSDVSLYNSDAWTISNNSFFETSFVPTGSYTYKVININTGTGNNILNNHIGGSAELCGGTWSKPDTYSNMFNVIYIIANSETGVTNIQGNTITNINWPNIQFNFTGITVDAGNFNIGTVNGNVIGAATGTSAIQCTCPDYGRSFWGINIQASGDVDCQNNIIGSINLGDPSGANSVNFYGINKGAAPGATIISNNTIGSNTTNGSININTDASSGSMSAYGIITQGTGAITITGNTISKITKGTTNSTFPSAGTLQGIQAYRGTSYTISSNTIKDLSIANSNTASDYTTSVIGIAVWFSWPTALSISDNTIYNLSNTYDSFAGNVIGLYFDSSPSDGKITGNFIHDLSIAGASSTSANIYGIKINAGATTYSNNIISLGGNTKTTIYGIYETGTSGYNNKLYFNTVYIGGSVASGSTNKSYAIYSAVNTNTRDFRNNIFTNVRSTTDGSSLHYALYIVSTGGSLSCDYNDYLASGTAGMLGYYGIDKSALPIVTGVTGNDAHSLAIDPVFASPGGTAAANYLPSATSLVANTGTGITTDYDGVMRSVTYPAMGAWEYTVTPLCSNPTSGGTIADNQTGCSPFDPVLLTNTSSPSGQTGTLEYKWQQSTTSSSAGFTDIDNSNSDTYDPPAGLTATTWYKRLARVDCMADWLGAQESNVIKITVDPVSVGGSIAGSAIVCSGTNSTTLTLSGHSGSIVKWQYSTDNWVTPVDVANITTSLVATDLILTTKYRTLVQSGVCSSTNSSDAIVTVDPMGQVNQPESQAVCNLGATALVAFETTNTGGATTYSWTNDAPG